MNLKINNDEKNLTSILSYSIDCNYSAQNVLSIDEAFDACVAMQKSLENEDSVALKEASQKLRNADVIMFSSLRCKDDSVASLSGHFVFDSAFRRYRVALGKDVYANADDIAERQITVGKLLMGRI